MKYKKGDLVRAINTSFVSGDGAASYNKGGIYTVKSHREGGSVMTEVDDMGSTTNGWSSEFFEPYVVEQPKKATSTQVGGTHYTDMAIQPAHYILANGISWAEGDAISYISRWRAKGGLQDLRKARQTLLLLIESEEAKGTK